MTLIVDLTPHLNARGWTSDRARRLGNLNAWGNSFPAEEWTEIVQIDCFRYCLQPPGGTHDHVEAWGQTIALPARRSIGILGLLAGGEMGDQEVTLDLLERGRIVGTGHAEVPSFMVERSMAHIDAPARICLTHFHYPGDYDLAFFRPALYHVRVPLPPDCSIDAIRLGHNPLFHVFAMSISVPRSSV